VVDLLQRCDSPQSNKSSVSIIHAAAAAVALSRNRPPLLVRSSPRRCSL
jgi:hypothetical protein